MIPGRALHRLALRICSAKSLERIVEPAIADLQKEYASAGANETTRRAWTLCAGYAAVFRVIAICALDVSIAIEDERRKLRRTLVWTLVFISMVLALLMWPVVGSVPEVTFRGLLPQALPLAIPIGVTFGIAVGLPGRGISHATAKVVILIALAASLVSFGTISWVMPAANQGVREEVAWSMRDRGLVPKGIDELTVLDLRREMMIAAARGDDTRIARRFAWTFHVRLALSSASLVLAALFLVSFSTGSIMRGVFAFLMCLEYWALLYTGEFLGVHERAIPAFVAAWLPNIVFISAAVLIASSRGSRLRGSATVAR